MSPTLDRAHPAEVVEMGASSHRKASAALERARDENCRERSPKSSFKPQGYMNEAAVTTRLPKVNMDASSSKKAAGADEALSCVWRPASSQAPASPTMSLRLTSPRGMVEGVAPAPARHVIQQRSPCSGGSRQERSLEEQLRQSISGRLSPRPSARQQQLSPRLSPRHQVKPRATTQETATTKASELDALGDEDTRVLRPSPSAPSRSPRSSVRGTPGSRIRRQSPPREPAAPPFLGSKSSPTAGGVHIGGIRVGGIRLSDARTDNDLQSQARQSSCDALWQAASAAPGKVLDGEGDENDSAALSSNEPLEPDLLV